MSDCATPQTAAPQAPPSLGFFRQEHWSGLPFPSPMHESEKWKWSRSVVSDSSRPHGLQPTRLLSPWNFPGKSTGAGCHFLLQGIFLTQGSNPGLPHCSQMLLPSEPLGKSKQAKYLYIENYKILLKNLKKSQINGKTSHIHGLKDSVWLKCQYYPSDL